MNEHIRYCLGNLIDEELIDDFLERTGNVLKHFYFKLGLPEMTVRGDMARWLSAGFFRGENYPLDIALELVNMSWELNIGSGKPGDAYV